MGKKLSGDGKVFLGQQFIADVHYDIQIQSNFKTTRTMEGEGRYFAGKTMQLQIDPPTAVSGYLGERLTLHRNDDFKQEFFVIDSHGHCQPTGEPYK
jgi:hypothetical protein